MVTEMYQTPRLERTVEGGVVVTRWGRVCGHLLRIGDRLVMGSVHSDGLLVLKPKGYGRPMLGRRSANGLVAEPSGVPASGLRWEVVGSVTAVERDLERGGVGAGNTHVVCRVEGRDIAALARARAIFSDGPRTERELIRLCSQAAVAPEELGVEVAIAAGEEHAIAEALLGQVQTGRIRFALPEIDFEEVHRGLVVPGPWRTPLPTVEAHSPTHRPARAQEVAENGAQLSLFGERASA